MRSVFIAMLVMHGLVAEAVAAPTGGARTSARAPKATPKAAPKAPAPKATPAPKAPAPKAAPAPAPKASPASPAPKASPASPAPKASPASPAPKASPGAPGPSAGGGVTQKSTPASPKAGPSTAPKAVGGSPVNRPTAVTPGTSRGVHSAYGSGQPASANAKIAVAGGGHAPVRTGGTVSSGGAAVYRAPVRPHGHSDHRYARPAVTHLHVSVHARYGVPHRWYYRPWYSHWYVHPYYRWHHATTVVVGLGFPVYAWSVGWVPPSRAGWMWVPGHWTYGWYTPGYWSPVAVAPIGYAYVPGWWVGDAYVEGYWRAESRSGWEWVEGSYLEDGTYIRGRWEPTGDGPDGYTWEPGFYDGEAWVDGFWRPEYRDGYRWVDGWFGDDGVYRAGYWEPLEARSGAVWVPGWFDGNEWVGGYWVAEDQYERESQKEFQPEQGWDAGRSGSDTKSVAAPRGGSEGDDRPLALPVEN